MEVFEDHPSAGWAGADVWWAQVAGQRLEMGGSTSYVAHVDAVGSMTMETDQTGAVTWDMDYYPWGQVWQTAGSRVSLLFGGLEWAVNDPLNPSATREYSPNVGRWMTPDPGGMKVVSLSDPQTWNMYAYAGDNPVTFNDPSGLQTDADRIEAHYGYSPGEQDESVRGVPSRANEGAAHGQAHEAAVVNQSSGPDENGNGGKVEVVYAKEQNTSTSGNIGGEVGAGASDITVTTGAGKPAEGKVNAQFLTANASGKAGLKYGASGSLGARVIKIGSQNSFSVEGWKVTIDSSATGVGLSASGHVTWGNGISVGGELATGLIGAGLSITVVPPEPPHPTR